MKDKAPTKEVQIQGVLTGSWPQDSAKFASNPSEVFSITRSDIADYLKRNPAAAHDYLKRWKISKAADIHAIWSEKGGYRVAWLAWDGKPSDVQEFSNLADAVVEHAARHNGIVD